MVWLTRIESHSMAPTLRDGQLVPTRKLRRTTAVRRGDLVVVASSEAGRHVVKRVVGLPGEHVALRLGEVVVDGRPLAEPHASRSVFTGEYDVPQGHYFLMGDNRDASSDSRSWRHPFVPRQELVGRLYGRRSSPAPRRMPSAWTRRWVPRSCSARRRYPASIGMNGSGEQTPGPTSRAATAGGSATGAIDGALGPSAEHSGRTAAARAQCLARILAAVDARLTDADRAALRTDDLYDDTGLPA